MEFKYCTIGNKDYGGLDKSFKVFRVRIRLKTLNKR